MRCRLFCLALAFVLGTSILSGCGPGRATDLIDTEWTLISLKGKDLIEDTEITLYFKEDYLGGSMTCNNYGGGPDSGKYEATGRGTLEINQLAVTVQDCSKPEGIMEQEAAYIEALRNAATYRVMDGRLEIDDAAGETTLIFRRPSSLPERGEKNRL
ncbi:MAG: META domain-containing protein [Anaerolineales bacterium]